MSLVRLLAAVVLSAAPAWASAEPKLPAGGPRDGVRILYLYAGCLVDGDRTRLENMLLQDQTGDAFRKWHKKLRGTCINLDNEDFYINPTTASLRLVVADLLARRVLGQLDAEKLVATPRLVHPAGSAQLGDPRLFEAAECLVRSAPQGAAEFLGTTPKSADKAAAADQLLRGVRGCTISGRLNVDMLSLRGSIAISYLRLARAATTPEGAR